MVNTQSAATPLRGQPVDVALAHTQIHGMLAVWGTVEFTGMPNHTRVPVRLANTGTAWG